MLARVNLKTHTPRTKRVADWKLEQLNVEHSRIDTLAEGETGPGLSWLLTLDNQQDIYVFASGPTLYVAVKSLLDVFNREGALDSKAELKKAVTYAVTALESAEGVQK